MRDSPAGRFLAALRDWLKAEDKAEGVGMTLNPSATSRKQQAADELHDIAATALEALRQADPPGNED